jgi:sugar phosphate isomerase/epimerase
MIRNTFFVLFILFSTIFDLRGQNTICEGQFSTYNFDIPGSSIDQVLILNDFGIQGIIISTGSDINSYLESPLVENGEFRIDVVYHKINISETINENEINNHLDLIANTDIIYSPIIRADENIEDSLVLIQLTKIADLCNQKNKEFVIYPHDNTFIQSIEEAIFWINQITLNNIKVSFHLCHELRQGHADQIDEILQDYFHMIRYATISGGDEVTDPNEPNWNDAIKPLGMGTFDLEIVLNKLIQLNFAGPVAIHTFGINESYDVHLPSSIAYLNDYSLDEDNDSFDFCNDCNDTIATINPDAIEVPNNGVDEDCDGFDLVTSIYELSNFSVNIYPNPAIDIVNIDISGSDKYDANVFDLAGKLITNTSNQSIIQIQTLPQGTYLLEIKDLNTGLKIVKRIVKWN